MHRTVGILIGLFALTVVVGCPKKLPQPEIDAAESAMADIEKTKDCAPETYQAAKTMMDRARALLKEERYEEAKTALLAAKRLAEKAKEECEKKRKEEEARKAKEPPPPEPASKEVPVEEIEDEPPRNLKTVYFGFNESNLTDEARSALANNSEYIHGREKLRIQVEGHCDSRGSTEYNLALGERRALAVKRYLVKLGVDPNRLEIISYGEERPADAAQTEGAWSKNRRAEFTEMK
jgi:peptidoglycan-associated lipoprotein